MLFLFTMSPLIARSTIKYPKNSNRDPLNVSLLTPHLLWFLFQKSSSSASSEASETCQSVSECSSPTTVSSSLGPQTFMCWNCQWFFWIVCGPREGCAADWQVGVCSVSLAGFVFVLSSDLIFPASLRCICKATHTKGPMPMSKGKGVSCYSDGLDLISPFRSWLVLRYLPPCSLSHWLHQAFLCHNYCVPTL